MAIQLHASGFVLPTLHPPASRHPRSPKTSKIAFIDPLSGPFAPVGQTRLLQLADHRDIANKEKWRRANYKFEVVWLRQQGAVPQESLTQLKTAIDQGYRTSPRQRFRGGAALIDAVNKHNERNPGKEVVFFNYAAIDPDLTNSKCSFWHFRFDANSDMKMEAMTSLMAKNGDEEGLPHRPELRVRPAGHARRQGHT